MAVKIHQAIPRFIGFLIGGLLVRTGGIKHYKSTSPYSLISVLLELGVPQGQVVSRWRGGEGVLKEALGRVKAASFTGYLKTSLSKEGDRSEALIAFTGGKPTLCLNVFQPYGMEEIWFLGERATEYMWADASQPEAIITLHGEVALRDFEQLFPQARIKKFEAPKRPMPLPEVRQEKLGTVESGVAGRKLDMMGPASSEAVERKKVDRQAKGVYDLILQYHKMHSHEASGGTCEVCGGPVDLLGYCRTAPPTPTKRRCASPAWTPASPLIPSLSPPAPGSRRPPPGRWPLILAISTTPSSYTDERAWGRPTCCRP